jgi:hypothetical protein
MNEPRNKQQDIAGLVFSLETKPLLFSSEKQFKKVVSMVSNLLVSLSPRIHLLFLVSKVPLFVTVYL